MAAKPTQRLEDAIRAARAAGMEVRRARLLRDGTVDLEFGPPQPERAGFDDVDWSR